MTHEQAKVALELILQQYNKGLVTEGEKNNRVFEILYQVLYPEQFEQA
ncbi:MAG: hypothetical protein PHQ43_16070 [Dehalococcoidales bacterium]|nr:hypothetical protein [Dehalococcoidales bacterium]